MVISVLVGGLGNQMFQYAFGLQEATKRADSLKLNDFLLSSKLLAKLQNYTLRQFELDAFGIDPPKTTPVPLLQSVLPLTKTVLVRDGDDLSSARFQHAHQIVCLGYWQSEHFFEEIADIVRSHFTFKKSVNSATRIVANNIRQAPDSVFVHVRRGDYVTNAAANKQHGVCGQAYYEQAVGVVREHVADPVFFVFSDDLPWVRQELDSLFGQAVYVDGNSGADSWQDMYLMSQCRHAIIANSSFSWWGAWLNGEPDQVVVAPAQWFSATSSSTTPVPDRWIRV